MKIDILFLKTDFTMIYDLRSTLKELPKGLIFLLLIFEFERAVIFD